MEPEARQFLQHGHCAQLARASTENVLEYFLATPFEPEKAQKALDICASCEVVVHCLAVYYDDDAAIAGNMLPYHRKIQKWKRVDNIEDSNWRGFIEFIHRVRGKEK